MSTSSVRRLDHTRTDYVYDGTFEDWLDTLELRIEGELLVEAYKIQRKYEDGQDFFMSDPDIRAFLMEYHIKHDLLTEREAQKMFSEVKR